MDGYALTDQEVCTTMLPSLPESPMKLQPIHLPCGDAPQPGPGNALQKVGRNSSAPQVVIVHSLDAEEQAQVLRQWDQTYVQLTPGQFEGRLIETSFGDTQFFRETTNQVIHESGRSRPGSRSFCVPLSMNGTTYFRGIEWNHDDCATMAGDVDIDLHTAAKLDLIGVSFRADKLAEATVEHELDPACVDRWLSGSRLARLPPGSVARLRRTLLDVAVLVEARSVLLENPAVRSGIESTLNEAFLSLMVDALDVRGPRRSYPPRQHMVGRAIEFVASHPADLVTVSDLCRKLRVSRRTLQLYFEEALHISPLQYLRAFRLNKVRTLIRTANGTLQVQDAAARWGFWHMSQFASDYKRLFGKLPSQDTSVSARRTA